MFAVVQLPSCMLLFATSWTAARQASLSLTNSQSLSKFMPIASVMLSAISSSDAHFSFCLQPFPGSGILPMSQLFASDDQNTGVSASVLPLTIQGGFPLKLTGLFSLLSKGLTGVFSSTTFRRHQFFSTPASFWSGSHSPYHVWPLGKPQPWQYGPLFAE